MNDTKPGDEPLEALLVYLKNNRGADFTGYKRSTLSRRVARRLEQLKVESVANYIDYLEVHPQEIDRLLDALLIQVTSFFRDPEAWQKLAGIVVPSLLTGDDDLDGLRVWSAGCASGEEAYTLAMILAEHLGMEKFRRRVKIYATDVDADVALLRARQAIYSAKDLDAVPAELRKRYFEKAGAAFAFRADLRRALIFGRHDLIHDAPISRVDLLVCRNVLMYFNAETQRQILARFHFALADHGVLFLGKAETLLTHANLFKPVDVKVRIFTKPSQVSVRDRLVLFAHTGDEEAAGHLAQQMRLRDEAANMLPIGQVVIDLDGRLVMINELARGTFGLTAKDVGRRLQDLEFSYRPLELRSLIERVQAERQSVRVNKVEHRRPGAEVQYFNVHVVPLGDDSARIAGIGLTFEEVTQLHRLEAELNRSSQELETAYEELQSTNEELETTNEELHSTVEELETTNEELQSTNEEQQTMNEELQSANEELQTANEELRLRTEELDHANASLESILASLQTAVAVVDRNLNVLMWNRRAEDLWGLRLDEIRGRPLVELDCGLPVAQLVGPLQACLTGSGDRELVLDTVNRRGRAFGCHVALHPLTGRDNGIQGAIILMDPRG